MASHKRKWEELDDSDDDEPSFGKQILPVADLPEDFDSPPTDGMQYLFTVRRDARQLPNVTRVANPFHTHTPEPLFTDRHITPSYVILPSEEWRSIFETRFKNFRKNLSQPTINVPFMPPNERQHLMPDKKERDLWWGYLAGKPESDWNLPKQTKQRETFTQHRFTDENIVPLERRRQESWRTNDEGEVELVLRMDPSESLPTPVGSPGLPEAEQTDSSSITSEIPEPITFKPREPLPSLLRYIDQRMALHLLMYFTHWINTHLQKLDPSSRLIETHARWIFALLAKVDNQISADDMSLLRNLARACIALLKKLTRIPPLPGNFEGSTSPTLVDNGGGFMGVRSCWIIISTVAGVWAQHDLWIDAEDMLKTLGP